MTPDVPEILVMPLLGAETSDWVTTNSAMYVPPDSRTSLGFINFTPCGVTTLSDIFDPSLKLLGAKAIFDVFPVIVEVPSLRALFQDPPSWRVSEIAAETSVELIFSTPCVALKDILAVVEFDQFRDEPEVLSRVIVSDFV